MIVVLDVSAAVEVVIKRPACRDLTRLLTTADWVIAPNLFISETCNVFWKYNQLTKLSYADCEQHIEQAIALPDDYFDESALYREAFHLGCELGHAIYDMMYLVLARRNSATLLTMDKSLQTLARKIGIETKYESIQSHA